MSIMIGVISYLPYNELRTQRLEACVKQRKWLNSLLPNAPMYYVLQQYKDADKEKLDGSNKLFYTFDEGLGAGNARNILLDRFYNSNYDWLLLCDDDTTAYPYYQYENFIRDIAEHPDKFSMVDAVSAVEPEYHAYKKPNYQDRANLTHYKFEPRELNSGSATSIIRNIYKYGCKQVFYPNVDAAKGEGREDMEFLIAWLKAGFNWYTMDTWIRKSLCFDKSSIFGYNVDERNKILMHDLDVICDRYRAMGLQRDINGKITWSNFNKTFNKSEKVLYIKRETPIEYDENTTPKEKHNSVKLF